MIVVVACGKAKRASAARADELYTGSLFRAHLRLADQLPGEVVILSAKHGVLERDAVVEPYELELGSLLAEDRARWEADVAAALEARTGPREPILALAGARYLGWRKLIRRRVSCPLEGLTLCERRKVIAALLNRRELDLAGCSVGGAP